MQMTKVVVAAVLLVGAAPAFAQTYTKITTRAGIGGDNYIDWGSVGDGTSLPNGSIFAANTGPGQGAVSVSGTGSAERLTSGTTWQAGFLPSEALLWTGYGNGPMTILFSNFGINGVYGVGSQVYFNYDNGGTPYDASIDLLGDNGVVLQSYNFSTGGGPAGGAVGQASFIGATSSTGNIKGIRFNNASNGVVQNDFAINRMTLNTLGVSGGNNGGGDPVPEPGEWAAMGILGAGLAGLVMRSRRKG